MFDYVLTARPFSLGVAPSNQISVSDRKIEGWFGHYEIISYDRKLTDEEINKFQLVDLSDEHFNNIANLVIVKMGKYKFKYLENEKRLEDKIRDVLSTDYASKIDVFNRFYELKELVISTIKAQQNN